MKINFKKSDVIKLPIKIHGNIFLGVNLKNTIIKIGMLIEKGFKRLVCGENIICDEYVCDEKVDINL